MANTLKRDPYKSFRFRVYFDDRQVAGVSKVTSPVQTTSVIEYRAGDDPLHKKLAPGQTNYGAVTLERGLTADREFLAWANSWHTFNEDEEKLKAGGITLRKHVKIALCDELGRQGVVFVLTNCWVSTIQTLPAMNSDDNSVAIESVTFETEGWSYHSSGINVWTMGGTQGRDSSSADPT